MAIDLWPHQQRDYDAIRGHFRRSVMRVLLCAPTGYGKTVLAGKIIERCVELGNPVLFLAHRKELIEQPSNMLDSLGIDHGVIKSGHWRQRPDALVQVASIQTLMAERACPYCKVGIKSDPQTLCSRCNGTRKISRDKPRAKLIVIDEAHRCMSPSYRQITESYPGIRHLGLTATPWRLDGQGLRSMYDELVASVGVQDLINTGYLTPIRVYQPDRPDLKGLHRRKGEYVHEQVVRLMHQPKLVGKIVEHWIRLAENRRTVIFASSVEHSQDIARRFVEAKIPAEHLDGNTSDADRTAVLGRLASGQTKVVSNVDLLVEGWDLPQLGCVVLARPTASLTRYLQQCGRGMRPSDETPDMILLDHAGCTLEDSHNLPTHPRRWTLDDLPKRKPREEIGELPAQLITCPICGLVRDVSVEHCPCTGVQIAVFTGMPVEIEEDLVEYQSPYGCEKCGSRDVDLAPVDDLYLRSKCKGCGFVTRIPDDQATKHASEVRRRQEFEKFEAIRRRKGYKQGWSAYRYREIFGAWPPSAWTSRGASA